jgi:fido (protein-threonine AMPylation protein)
VSLLPACPTWVEHPDDRPIIAANIAALLLALPRGSREPFSLTQPLAWHTRIHENCTHIPLPQYVGHYRGDPLPCISTYEVVFGGAYKGVPAAQVQSRLAPMAAALQASFDELDAIMRERPDVSREYLNRIVRAAARHYLEWVRIHPFADGNGRTARVLVNLLFLRYWQPIVFPGRPPPERAVLISATGAALAGDMRPLERFIKHRLVEAVKRASKAGGGRRK